MTIKHVLINKDMICYGNSASAYIYKRRLAPEQLARYVHLHIAYSIERFQTLSMNNKCAKKKKKKTPSYYNEP